MKHEELQDEYRMIYEFPADAPVEEAVEALVDRGNCEAATEMLFDSGSSPSPVGTI
mgnify:CR=1 FL=1